jgi:CBS domain-containing protein
MKVRDIMQSQPKTCTPDTTIAQAAHLMWEGDCGVLPVVDDDELTGIVTDRDMYIALATQNERAALLRVGAVATTDVVTCEPDDDVLSALASMQRARVRRLPVVSRTGTLLGMLSLNDVILALDTDPTVEHSAVVDTLKAICARPDAGALTRAPHKSEKGKARRGTARHSAVRARQRGATATAQSRKASEGRAS